MITTPFNLFHRLFGTVPSTPLTTDRTIIFMFHNFLISITRSTYLSIFSQYFRSTPFSGMFSFHLILPKSCILDEIGWLFKSLRPREFYFHSLVCAYSLFGQNVFSCGNLSSPFMHILELFLCWLLWYSVHWFIFISILSTFTVPLFYLQGHGEKFPAQSTSPNLTKWTNVSIFMFLFEQRKNFPAPNRILTFM